VARIRRTPKRPRHARLLTTQADQLVLGAGLLVSAVILLAGDVVKRTVRGKARSRHGSPKFP
jgi:hypothetical protein